MLSRAWLKYLAAETRWSRTLATLVRPEVEVEEEFSRCRPYSEIPGPNPIPLLGNTWRFIPYIGDFEIQSIDKLSRRLHRQYGDIVKMSGLLGRPDMVFVYDADEIEKIFRQEEKMPFRPSMPSLNYYKHVLRKDFFEDCAGVIAVHGESWYTFRSKVQQVMLQPRTARMYTGAIDEASSAFLKRVSKIRDENKEVPANFLNEIHKWSLESIARVALDVRLGCLDDDAHVETQELIDAVIVFFKNVGVLELKLPFWRFFNTPTWNDYVNALDTIFSFATKYTSLALSRVKDLSNNEELSLLERILLQEKDTKLASVLALDLFLVGIDTTSSSVASVLYQLAQHPDKQQVLYEELSKNLPKIDESLQAHHLDHLRYLRACIKETLRMFPVVIGNGRCMTKDTVISGYRVPSGVQVVFQHYVISNTDKYFPKSGEFLPERWLCDHNAPRHAFASLPFGYGRRMCLGRRFAELEIAIVIARIIQSYKLEYHYENLDYYINPMYTPNGPLKLRFVERN